MPLSVCAHMPAAPCWMLPPACCLIHTRTTRDCSVGFLFIIYCLSGWSCCRRCSFSSMYVFTFTVCTSVSVTYSVQLNCAWLTCGRAPKIIVFKKGTGHSLVSTLKQIYHNHETFGNFSALLSDRTHVSILHGFNPNNQFFGLCLLKTKRKCSFMPRLDGFPHSGILFHSRSGLFCSFYLFISVQLIWLQVVFLIFESLSTMSLCLHVNFAVTCLQHAYL